MPEPNRQLESLSRGPIHRPAWLMVAALAGAFVLGACNPSGKAAPTPVPTQPPALEVPTSSVISTTGACLDPATAAILGKLATPGAGVSGILANNRDALIKGLQGFQPQDSATATWRDQLVAALQAGDMVKAATEVQMLASAQVAVASC